MFIGKTELTVSGRLLRIARLRHEWFEYPDDPVTFVKEAKTTRGADLLTFLGEAHLDRPRLSFQHETASSSVLTVKGFDNWWNALDFKVRNKIRKAQKNGVELRPAQLDDDFVRGVEVIYNESPLRQGRKFWHYGKNATVIKQDLSSFPGCTFFIGAYYQGDLIGFMKLFEGNNILRTVHIIAKLSQRDKPVQDALIAKAVELCDQKKITYLHYGSWSRGGLGAFKIKHGFQRFDSPRYFVPLTFRGNCLLKLKLHHQPQDYLPEKWLPGLIALRAKWNSFRRAERFD